MKLISFGKEWILIDGESKKVYKHGAYAFGYAFIMMGVRKIPCTTPALHPVRSLTPKPKKRELSERQLKLVRKIKADMPACYI